MFRLLAARPPAPPPPPSNHTTTTAGLLTTLLVSFVAWMAIQSIFEFNRFYKQIYLKRLQRRFIDINRVPPEPPIHLFGWLKEIRNWSESDILRMVGLDAYMLLRYQTICYKLSLFMCFWGILVLVPLYSSADTDITAWDKYTLNNVSAADTHQQYRYWFAAIFSYMFSAYFCQLLHAEYNNFSIRRLQFLVQADPDSPMGDPDTPQQKYFTIMIERIPSHLRSAQALHKFFDNLFPGEVYNVEVALDLKELDNLSYCRKVIRDKLEKAIASYEATGVRPLTYVKTFNHTTNEILTASDVDEFGIKTSFQAWWDPDSFGYENFDAINYYTNRLVVLNKKTQELQKVYYSNARKSDKVLEKRIKDRHDTHAARIYENLTKTFASTTPKASADNGANRMFNSTSSQNAFSVDAFLFGPPPQDVNQAIENEMIKVELSTNLNTKSRGNTLVSNTNTVSPQTIKSVTNQYDLLDSSEEGKGDNNNNDTFSKNKNNFKQNKNINSINETIPQDWITEYNKSEVTSMTTPPSSIHHKNKLSHIQTTEGEDKESPHFSGWHHKHDKPNLEYIPIENDQGLTILAPVTRDMNVRFTEPSIGNNNTSTNNNEVINPLHDTNNDSDPKTMSKSREIKKSFSSNTMSNLLPSVQLPSIQLPESEQLDAVNAVAKESIQQAKKLTRKGWLQTRLAGMGAFRSVVEAERAFEYLTFGAYYKYSTTAFVTFNSRITECICYQMMLSHDAMDINHAPNPNDIIWSNVALPKSQVTMRSFIVDTGLIIGSLFWSSLVNAVNKIGHALGFPPFIQGYFNVLVMLVFLLILPFIFDFLARFYEGMKLESEIQNAIMARYFYYQLVNIYVTVGFGTDDILVQITKIIQDPHLLIVIIGQTVPSVSLYFASLVIVKIFVVVPIEMMRPWQLSTILSMTYMMDKRKCTRRDLRTGAFYSWPMLYGWIYPQLMMVLMIQVTYACIAPFLMPLCSVFFVFSYTMYKYQLLYVYINTEQSGGYMWYAVFARSLVALLFAVCTLLGYLALNIENPQFAGPFFFLLPLPFCVGYFWNYCDHKFKKQSLNLSLTFAKELDHRNRERKAAGKQVPHDMFKRGLYRQPSLTERPVYPEPYRMDDSMYTMLADATTNSPYKLEAAGENEYENDENDYFAVSSGNVSDSKTSTPKKRNNSFKLSKSHEDFYNNRTRDRRGTVSLAVTELVDEDEMDYEFLKMYFEKNVIPLANAMNSNDNNSSLRSSRYIQQHGQLQQSAVMNPLHSDREEEKNAQAVQVELAPRISRHLPRHFTSIIADNNDNNIQQQLHLSND